MVTSKEILDELTANIKSIFNDSLLKIILYGSRVRNDGTEESDIDFVVLTDLEDDIIREKERDVTNISVELSLKYDSVVSVLIINYDIYKKYLNVLPFYKNIETEGIEVYGR
ncbi:MAG: nucleotidyltransferase domain-containing protein [Bacteroidota bacterium]|nr:nucleotidyltransferase domain-containing protein [Bacteroidota bacterium]